MNFCKVIKEEILSKPPKDRCCKKAFLSGLIRGTGVLYESEGGLGIEFSVQYEETAMLVSNYLKVLFDYDLREVAVGQDRLNKKDKFTLNISGDKTTDILLDIGVLENTNGEINVNLKPYKKLEKDCCVKSFFRGLFVAIGNVTIPSKNSSANTGYHLELVFSHYTPALETSEMLAKSNVQTKITRRKDDFIVYIKSAEEIKNFTAFLGAPISVLKLTDFMINRDISNNSNRQRNCDIGNASRQADAVTKQLYAIEKIEKKTGLNVLKQDLLETAVFRRNNPDDTLSELAKKLNVSKSCLNHRLRKIISISENI